MKLLFLDWNLGLGDAIICNGLVRFLSAQEARRKIVLPCWERNLPTVRHMFSDLANVHVVLAEGDNPNPPSREYDVLRIGLNNPNWGRIAQWDEAFYRFADVSFDAKWDMFHVPRSPTEAEWKGGENRFSLLHEDKERGFMIDEQRVRTYRLRAPILKPCVEMSQLAFLTDWRNLISRANEIHCIDSAPMCLIELLPTTGKLFYHKYARHHGSRQKVDQVLRKPWVILE